MRKARARRRYGLGAAVAAAVIVAACPVLAQGWWPWSNSEPERAPVPDEPVYREPPPQGAEPSGAQPSAGAPPPAAQAPPPQDAPAVNWSTKNPICLQLEQRLVQESHRANQTRDTLPSIEAEMRQVDQTYQTSQSDLDRSDCYEYFLFSKSLRRTRRCIDLARARDQAQRRLSELEAQRQQIVTSSERSYRDDIVRELARNSCGANYTQEARRVDRGGYASIWQDEDESNYSNRWTYGGGGATYRTVCVRLCDGYYFPVSFSTLPSHFEQDATVCQSKCAAPAELYYYQNPGAVVDQSVAFRTQEPYTSLKSAFRYRKELVRGCSCKESEYVDPNAADAGKRADTGATTGWEARSESEDKQR